MHALRLPPSHLRRVTAIAAAAALLLAASLLALPDTLGSGGYDPAAAPAPAAPAVPSTPTVLTAPAWVADPLAPPDLTARAPAVMPRP